MSEIANFIAYKKIQLTVIFLFIRLYEQNFDTLQRIYRAKYWAFQKKDCLRRSCVRGKIVSDGVVVVEVPQALTAHILSNTTRL